jgi:hypothetical protein
MPKAKPSPVAKAFNDAMVVLDAAFSKGVSFSVNGDKLMAKPSAAVDEELARLIRGRKDELILIFSLPDILVNCPFFTVVEGSNELAACLSCGASWELHDKPSRDRWKIKKHADVEKCGGFEPRFTERFVERTP